MRLISAVSGVQIPAPPPNILAIPVGYANRFFILYRIYTLFGNLALVG